MFSSFKDKTTHLYASLQADFSIEYDRDLNKYLGIELEHCPDGSIYISQSYLTQRIVNIIPGMDK